MAPILLMQLWWQDLHETSLSFLFLFFLLLINFSLLYFLKLTRGAKLNLPPSPPKLPIIGNLHQLGRYPHRSLEALSKEYGPLMLLNLGKTPTLVVSSAEAVREIVNTHDSVFANRPQTKAANSFYYGCTDVGFLPYGEYWRQMKKICVLELLSFKRVQSFEFVRKEEVTELIEKIRSSCFTRDSLNLREMLVNISISIVSRSVLGRKYVGEVDKKKFGQLTRKVMDLMMAFCFGDFFPYLGWMDVLSGFAASLKEISRAVDNFFDQVIKEHQAQKGLDEGSDRKYLIDILFDLQKDGMHSINVTFDNVKAILLDMFIAGTDTASTMEWAMAELVKNPPVMKKAQEEVRRVVRKKSQVDENEVNQMNYLKCVIKETLRLHPPAPLAPRESSVSAKVKDFDIPAKTRVFINIWAIQRDTKFWDRPGEFLPERFESNLVDFKGQDFQFIPFGAGRRSCPGLMFALAEMEYVLANLLFWFDWELPGGGLGEDLDMSEAYGLVVRKKIPLQLFPVLHSS